MQYQESAGVVVYTMSNQGPRYLLLKYSNGGHWDFAKGKIEPGETKQTAAVRELQEEAGIEARIDPSFEYSFSYQYEQRNGNQARKTVYFFVGVADSHTIILSSEHTQYAWASYDDAVKLLTFDTAKQLLSEVHAFIMQKG